MFNRDEVLKFINSHGHVSIDDIRNQFRLSASTARRIVTQLEKKGRAGRFHGGAYSVNYSGISEVIVRRDVNAEKKTRIARAAAGIIAHGSTCIILGGSTVGYMCKFIKDKHMTVITNSILIFNELKRCPTIRLIVLGGLDNPNEEELGGIIANANLLYLRADYLFMGASSFDDRAGFINNNESISLYHTCISACTEVCVLVDSSKYNCGGTSIAAKPRQVRHLFTDSGLSAEATRNFREKGVLVTLI
ncbi:MAG: DeoR/GlpR family DNA-binding transcription regulator [Planctomycetota bacterium]|jgi:DeoR family transcriptional regulator of aga operon|nr:DeoR/GlpR family DNA-binding transcription regulator [Planctomycetota bacterium]